MNQPGRFAFTPQIDADGAIRQIKARRASARESLSMPQKQTVGIVLIIAIVN
jgi:hypothetical protein